MKAQAFTVPSEIGLVIMGAIFIWIGVTILEVLVNTSLVGSFDLYIGGGFILADIVAIIHGILSLVVAK